MEAENIAVTEAENIDHRRGFLDRTLQGMRGGGTAFFRTLTSLALPVTFIVLWEIAAQWSGANNILLPPASRVFATLLELIMSGILFDHIGASLRRVAVGYAVAGLVGIPIGLAVGYSMLTERLLGGAINGLRPIPASAWIPLSIVLFGIGEKPAVFLVFIGTVWVVILNSIHGVRNAPKHLLWAARTMGATDQQVFRKVIFPAALPSIFTGLRIAVGIAFTCVITAELIAVRSGLGYLITEGRMLVRSDIVIAGMIAIGTVGFLLDFCVRAVMGRALAWQKGLVGNE